VLRCKLTEVVPGLYTAHFNDIQDPDIFKSLGIEPLVRLVVNAGTDKCPTSTGYYGPKIDVLRIDLLDDPTPGDAKQYFEEVNAAISNTIESGSSAVVHCLGFFFLLLPYFILFKY
jgi:hypothetical protein